jgi:hypothetical protein
MLTYASLTLLQGVIRIFQTGFKLWSSLSTAEVWLGGWVAGWLGGWVAGWLGVCVRVSVCVCVCVCVRVRGANS